MTKKDSKVAVRLGFGHLSHVGKSLRNYKVLAYTLAAGFLLRPSLRLCPLLPWVYPHGIKLVAFKEGSVCPQSTGSCSRASINVPKTA